MERSETKKWLDEILEEFSRASFLYSDPLQIVHTYSDPRDQEIVALVTALFSFGNVKSIQRAVQEILKPLGRRPYDTLLHLKSQDFEKKWKGSYYRFYRASDVIFLLKTMQRTLRTYDDLESAFLNSWNGEVLPALSEFRSLLLGQQPFSPGLKFMFADPLAGTAKRWHMFLRWMVRKDEVDLGLWTKIPKSKLIQPLDTHLYQIGVALQLTRLKSPTLKAALQMTESFRKWDPADPIKYDFALCRLGVLRKRDTRLCQLIGTPTGRTSPLTRRGKSV